MNFKQESLGIRVLIKPSVLKETESGIIVGIDPRKSAIEADRGEVFMVGSSAWGDWTVKPDIKPGDKVFYSKYGAKTIKPDPKSDDYLVIANDVDILVGYSE